ncbi:hypothetical protein ACSSS7_001045 [Eimeria intestinalis]
MAKMPTLGLQPTLSRDSSIWAQSFSSLLSSEACEAKYTEGSSSVEDGLRLRQPYSMPVGGAAYVFKTEALPVYKYAEARSEVQPPSYFMPDDVPHSGAGPGSPTAHPGGTQCVYSRYGSRRTSIISVLPSEEPQTACATHILKQSSFPGRNYPRLNHTRSSGARGFTEHIASDDVAKPPPVRRVEQPVVFSSFFDKMQLDHLVAAKDKILHNIGGRSGEGSPTTQPPDIAHIAARCSEGRSMVDPSVQVVGGVDLGILYNRYKKDAECGACSVDGDTASASQATAEPSPTASDSEGDSPVSREKVFRTEAAARLAASPAASKVASHAAPAGGVRVMGLWPKHAQEQQPTCLHKAAKAAEQPSASKPEDGRACRIAHRLSAETLRPSIEDRIFRSPRQMLSSIAQEGAYTHIIPVSRSGSPKGLVRNTGTVQPLKGHKGEPVAARVVEACEYRFFVFNIPETEIIRSRDFQLTSCISQGSFGTVYRAKWKGSTVAVKQAHGKMTLEAMRSVAREVNSYRMIDHPFIVKYYGVCLEHNFVALVTEYLTGGNIFDILYENKVSISAAIRLKMCRQLLEAVHFLHMEKRLVHRDLKTANLVVDAQYNIRLCDFGKTRSLEHHGKLRLEDNGGSPRYMAPECFVEGNFVDQKVDIWGLACCLIEILGGPIPFEDIHSNEGVIQELLYKRRLPKVPSWFHPAVRGTLDRCFRWNASDRPDAQQLKDVFAKLTPGDLNQYGMNQKRTS